MTDMYVFVCRQVGDKVYKSFVKEKQKAKHQYQQAVDGGLTAGHLAVRYDI